MAVDQSMNLLTDTVIGGKPPPTFSDRVGF